jgi:hypothetical protein
MKPAGDLEQQIARESGERDWRGWEVGDECHVEVVERRERRMRGRYKWIFGDVTVGDSDDLRRA